MASVDRFRSWARAQGAPATIGLLASLIGVALAFWFTQSRGILLFALSQDSLSRPWSFLTYAWADMPFLGLNLLFYFCFISWTFYIGGQLERELGTARYLGLWIGSVLLCGLTMWGATLVLARDFVLLGPYLPIDAVSLLWCARNQNAQIRLYGIIPLTGRMLAIGLAIITLLGYGLMNPLMGGAALIPLVIGWLMGTGKVPIPGSRRTAKREAVTRGQVPYDDSYFTDVKRREREREERERLRKLFEGSLEDDPER